MVLNLRHHSPIFFVNHVPVASVGTVPVGGVVEERIPLSCGPSSLDWGSRGSGLTVELDSRSIIPSLGKSSSKGLNESGRTKRKEKVWTINITKIRLFSEERK